MFGVIWTHENTASSPSCLPWASTVQHIPLQQALLMLFPGIDACKMNIVWKQWIILPRPPNMCLLLITLVHYSSTSKQNEWPGFISLCIPPPLFPTHYSTSPWSMDICFIALCEVPCVLQNRTIVTGTFSVNVVWDLDIFCLPFSLLWDTVLFSELSNQQVTYDWGLLESWGFTWGLLESCAMSLSQI